MSKYDFDDTKDIEPINPNPYINLYFTLQPRSKAVQFSIDSASIKAEDTFPPFLTEEEQKVLDNFFAANPHMKSEFKEAAPKGDYTVGLDVFDPEDAWIQTFSGKRFTPCNPKPEAIVIQDIAHALSMQCRFAGHCKYFYSVAQHSVLVSYICDTKDALWGVLHDATEAYLVDIPRPLKHSGKFDAYLTFEKIMQKAICTRFKLEVNEPESVKIADKIVLATEARDIRAPLRTDWVSPAKPLPFKIEPLSPDAAETLFLDRFYELIGK